MAKKRKQHFVPKSLLKHFAEGKLVNIMKMEDGRIIPNVGYGSQCQIKYFYGKEGLEDILGEIESRVAPIIKKIIKVCTLEIQDVILLLFFIALQITRTEKDVVIFSKNTSEMLNEISELANMDIHHKPISFYSPVMHVNTAFSVWPALTDLKYEVIKNNTKVPFVFSDNPVVRYNQYYRNDDVVNQTGITCKGLIITCNLGTGTVAFLSFIKKSFQLKRLVIPKN